MKHGLRGVPNKAECLKIIEVLGVRQFGIPVWQVVWRLKPEEVGEFNRLVESGPFKLLDDLVEAGEGVSRCLQL